MSVFAGSTTMKSYAAGVLCSLLVGAGCGGPGQYARNRASDLADTFRLTASVGFGLEADAYATRYVALGGGKMVVLRGGTIGRHFGSWAEGRSTYHMFVWRLYRPRNFLTGTSEIYREVRGGRLPFTAYPVTTIKEQKTAFVWEDDYIRPAEIALSLHVLLLGAEFGFDPFELVDFAAGLLTLDLLGDDAGERLEQQTLPAEDN